MRTPVDNEQVKRAAGGDAQALAALVAAHYEDIYRMAWRWVGTRDEAQDVAQDVCVKLARAIRSFRAEASLATWLHRVTFNAAIDHIKARERQRRAESADVVVLFPERVAHSPETDALLGEAWDEVQRLPPQQRDAVILVYAEGLTHAEAATVMDCAEKTVSWHVHEALKRLRARLKAAG